MLGKDWWEKNVFQDVDGRRAETGMIGCQMAMSCRGVMQRLEMCVDRRSWARMVEEAWCSLSVVVVVVTEWWVSVSVSSAANVATRRWVEWQCRTTTTELFSISSHDTKLSPLAASVSVNSCVHIFVSCLISLLTDKCWHECLKAFAQYRAGKIPTEPVFEHFSTDVIAHLYYYLKVIVWKFGYLYI